MVNITERDNSDRIINHCATDFEGNFSMVVKSTANKLEITYIGYKTQRIDIGSRTVFNIKMVEDAMLDEVVVVAKQVQRSGGLDILEREMTHATQKISMDDMEGLSFASVDQALQGQIAGLDVVFSSGDVGSGTQMRLRGNSVLDSSAGGDSNPLIVVDDNIFEMGDNSNFDFETATDEKFAELLMVNTEDIAEIEVLKDAASCAVWGSRGANGVIKIKTKRGKRGPTRVNFSYKFQDKWTPSGINLLNGDDYTMLIKQSLFNRNQQAVDIPELNYDKNFSEYENYNNNTDWVDAVSQHGYRNEYNLNLSGGGEKATFRIAGGYNNETGQVIGQNMQRFTTRLALDYYVSSRIKVIADFSFSYTKQRRNTIDLLAQSLKMMPNMSIYKQDKEGNNTDEYYSMLDYENPNDLESTVKSWKNPIAVGNLAQYHTENYNISPQITFEYNLLGLEDDETQLKYRGMVNLSASTSAGTTYEPAALSTSDWNATEKNKSVANDSKSLSFTTRHQFIFTPYLGNKDHFLTMNAQFELRTSSGNSQNSTAVGLPTGNISSSTVGAKPYGAGTSKWESRNISFVYDAHYSYKSKYSLRFAIRGEGLTSMGDNQKWVAYPSLSARWNVIDEPWMEWARPVVSMFSLRPGWGMDGHAPGENMTYNSYSAYNDLAYLGMAAFQMDAIRLTDLRCSRKSEWNIGSDLGFFNGKLTGAFNYYNGVTSDQLISSYKIPSPTGYERLGYKNSGSVRNSGWEVNMNLNNLKLAKDFSLSLYFNVGKNYNEILELEEAYLEDRNEKYESPQNTKYLGRVQIGNPGGAIYGFRYKGVYRYSYRNWEKALAEEAAGRNGTCPIVRDADGNVVYEANGTPKKMVLFYDKETETSTYEFRGGDAIYEDVNHDGTINQLDIVYLGNSNPKAQGGFGCTFRYKKWTLRTSFTYRWDVDVVNSSRMGYENMASFENQSRAVNWRWRKDGDITEIPRAVYGNNAYNYLGSDRYVEDASYIRLSYLQLSYSFEPEWLKKVGLKNLNVFFSADNLCFWTKYTGLDPEVACGGGGVAYDGSRTPRSRSYTVSVSLGF